MYDHALTLSLCVALSLGAQGPAQLPQQASISTIDLAAASVPDGFDGADIKLIVNALAAPKGEYESTIDYQKRMARAFDPARVYAFKVESGSPGMGLGGDLRAEYNADSQAFHIRFDVRATVIGSDSGWLMNRGTGRLFQSLQVLSNNTSGGTYEATNGYGVKATVTRTIEVSHLLAFPSMKVGGKAPMRIWY